MAKFYIRFHSYWQNAPDYFCGPFDSHEAAEAEIQRANDETPGVNFVRGDLGQSAPNVRYDMRIAGIMTTTAARKAGMRDDFENDNLVSNLSDNPADELNY